MLTRRSLGLMLRSPVEFFDRACDEAELLADRLRTPPEYPVAELEGVAAELGAQLGRPVDLGDPELKRVEAQVLLLVAAAGDGPFPAFYSAGLPVARMCFAICRATRPSVVLETGVAYGVTSAFILAALELNGHGRLHSVDRPPWAPEAERFVGAAVPESLRERWTLHRGSSKRVLPRLLPDLGRVDLFVRDSLYARRTVLRELRAVRPHLAPGGLVVADDVQHGAGFAEWVAEAECPWWAAMNAYDPPRRARFAVALTAG